jgi:hypothetical protein
MAEVVEHLVCAVRPARRTRGRTGWCCACGCDAAQALEGIDAQSAC